MNADLLHLIGSVATLAAIVALVVTGNGNADIINPLLVVLGGQVGYKIGVQKSDTKNV